MRLRRFSTALMLVFGIGLLSIPHFSLPSAVAAPTVHAESDLSSEILDITPILEPGDTLEVELLIRNSGKEIIRDGDLHLRFNSAQLISRSSVEMWQEPDEETIDPTRTAGRVVATLSLQDLEPGAERVETISIASDQLYLPKLASQWGPRGIAVDTVVAGELVQRERSFALWFPAAAENIYPTQFSLLVPLVGAPPGSEMHATQSARLQNLLSATQAYDVVFALDPQLLDDDALEISRAELKEAVAGKEVFALPRFDADASALAQLGVGPQKYIEGARSAISSELEVTASDLLLWPENLADLQVAELAADYETAGVGALITSGSQLQPVDPLTFTPTGRARVSVPGGSVPALIPEEIMTRTFTTAAAANVSNPPVIARQRLLADSAVITQERPADPRHVLVTVPRDWDPNAERTRELLGPLTTAPWIKFTGVRSLLGAPVGDIEREPLPEWRSDSAQVDAKLLEKVAGVQQQLDEFRSLTAQPETVLPQIDNQLAGIIANGWRQAPQERTALVEQMASQVTNLEESVQVIPSGAVNLITDTGEIPVLINNDFSQPLDVSVRLQTSSSFLKTTNPIGAQLPAQSETSVLVPVEAIGNRDVEVSVRLESADGEQIGESQKITVRVRAGWEDAGTRIIGGILIFLFITGIIRTIWRIRKRSKS